jgi:Arc/MetJ-type ribon-helix-helix transcriptional regulator
MTIEIHTPELEALIEQRMQSGAFQDVDDLLMEALRAPSNFAAELSPEESHRRRLVEWMAQAGSGWNLQLHPELAQGAAHWVDSLRHNDETTEIPTS